MTIKRIEINFDRKKKLKEGEIIKQNQFENFFEKKLQLNKWGSNLKDKKNLRGMKLKRHTNFINYSR